MKFKYYLRGLGVGLIFATIILSIVLLTKSDKMSDAEIIERATELGMVWEKSSTLDSASSDTVTSSVIASKEDNAGSGEKKEVKKKPIPENNIKEEDSSAPVSSQEKNTKEEAEETEDQTENQKETDNTAEEPRNDPSVAGTEGESSTLAEETQTEVSVQEYPLSIYSGMSSDEVSSRLKDMGVISDKAEFDHFLQEYGYDQKIQIGDYSIPSNATFEQIARIIIGE